MTIGKNANGAELTIALAGRLDTASAPRLEAKLRESLGA